MAAWIKGNRYLSRSEMENNSLIVYEYLIGKGWSINAIAGVLGNMETESNINPAIWQSLDYGNYSLGYGLVQWTPATNYINWANNHGYDITDGYKQLDWLDSVTVSFGQWLPTSSYPLSFNDFKVSTQTPEYLASAFLKNFERAGEPVEAQRQAQARTWYNYLVENGGSSGTDENTQIIEDAIAWMISIANDDSHGYDQTNRWGPDYDCASLVISAFEQAGCPVKTNGASYTGNMVDVFKATGFEVLTYTSGMELKRGDVLWHRTGNSGHTEVYIGDGKNVGAHINENGSVTGGMTGDQTGNEISVTNFYEGGWMKVLRLPASGIINPDIPDPPIDPPDWYIPKKKKGYNFILFQRRKRGGLPC